jgi:predicted nucleic acid-binding protein
MKYLVDTDWLIDVASGIASAVSTIEGVSSEGFGVSIISVGELYEGTLIDADQQATLARYREFLYAERPGGDTNQVDSTPL